MIAFLVKVTIIVSLLILGFLLGWAYEYHKVDKLLDKKIKEVCGQNRLFNRSKKNPRVNMGGQWAICTKNIGGING